MRLKRLFSGYVKGKSNKEEERIVEVWYERKTASAREKVTEQEAEAFSEEAWQEFKDWRKSKKSQKSKRMRLMYGGAAAAVIAVMIILFPPAGIVESAADLYSGIVTRDAHYTESGDKLLSLVLEDGTKISVNKNSRFRVLPGKFNSKVREVELIGEAFFEVARDENRPFIVHTPGGLQTQVLGTSFNITAYEELGEQTVTVLTGLVKVSDAGEQSVLLKPDFSTVYKKEKGTLSARHVDAGLSTAWREGTYYLNEASFAEVALRIKQIYNLSLFVSDDIQLSQPIHMTLSYDIPPEVIAQGLADVYHVSARIENNTLILAK
ncbi:MAG TPA: hypothetical protein DDZ96_06105 [Porphyromonadaceae bacterium]|jgi:ferric-dicitrate binding protein FerR (iron transport regulator)|nr:hypothetical protein [Porphyromonadaceae bacterium]HBL33380.1 hypothetical protein [Porphyromonadaceae bacterium]